MEAVKCQGKCSTRFGGGFLVCCSRHVALQFSIISRPRPLLFCTDIDSLVSTSVSSVARLSPRDTLQGCEHFFFSFHQKPCESKNLVSWTRMVSDVHDSFKERNTGVLLKKRSTRMNKESQVIFVGTSIYRSPAHSFIFSEEIPSTKRFRQRRITKKLNENTVE